VLVGVVVLVGVAVTEAIGVAVTEAVGVMVNPGAIVAVGVAVTEAVGDGVIMLLLFVEFNIRVLFFIKKLIILKTF
jgi:hypothetical protein